MDNPKPLSETHDREAGAGFFKHNLVRLVLGQSRGEGLEDISVAIHVE